MLTFIALKSEKSAGGSPEIQNAPLGSKRDFFVCAGTVIQLASNNTPIKTVVTLLFIHDLRCASGSPTLNGLSDRRRLLPDRRKIVPRRAPEPFLRCSQCLSRGRRV